MEKGLFYGLMLMMLLLFSSSSSSSNEEAVMVAEARRTCESKSHGFKGKCLSDHNCGLVCRNEGFTDGWCRGFRRRCYCTKAC